MSDIATASESTGLVSEVRLLMNGRIEQAAAGTISLAGHLLPGKMLRTRLAARLLRHDTISKRRETVTRMCAATELVHTASLCHDDVVDNGLIRRSRPTLWRTTTRSAAVLIGDLLLCEAMRLLVDTEDGCHVRTFVEKVREVCAAEIEQELVWRGRQPDQTTRLRLARGKTGPFFALVASVCVPPDEVLSSALEEAGYRIGTAYQLADDLLDVVGDAEACGKTLGTDLKRRKPTLPQIPRESPASLLAQIQQLCRGALACVETWPATRMGLVRFLNDDLQPVLGRCSRDFELLTRDLT